MLPYSQVDDKMGNNSKIQSQDLSDALHELSRLDVEWISFVALRDAIAVALRDVNLATRNETLRLAEGIMPRIFDRDNGVLRQEWETQEARECREEAAITGQSFRDVVNSKVKHYEGLISRAKTKDQISTLAARRDSYQKLISDKRDEKSFYEGKIILADASRGANKQSPNLDVFDFHLPSDRWMRIRVTHETATEAINGTDLIYEHHSRNSQLIRIAAVQYKIMDARKNLVKNERVSAQLNRLDDCFCTGLPCQAKELSPPNSKFRFPTCTAFLKATNRLQSKNSAGISVGYYATACTVKEAWSSGKAVNPSTLEGEIITHRIFEDLFNAGNIGSRWLQPTEVESLYRDHKLLDANEKVAIQIQLFS